MLDQVGRYLVVSLLLRQSVHSLSPLVRCLSQHIQASFTHAARPQPPWSQTDATSPSLFLLEPDLPARSFLAHASCSLLSFLVGLFKSFIFTSVYRFGFSEASTLSIIGLWPVTLSVAHSFSHLYLLRCYLLQVILTSLNTSFLYFFVVLFPFRPIQPPPRNISACPRISR